MYNKFTTIICFISLINFSNAQSFINLDRYQNLKGNPIAINEIHHTGKANFGDIETNKWQYTFKSKLNDKKQIIDVYYIDDYKAYNFKYDDDQNLIENSWNYDEAQIPYYIKKYHYSDDRLIKTEIYQKHTFDGYQSLNLTNKSLIKGNHILESSVDFKYDDQGNILSEDYFGISEIVEKTAFDFCTEQIGFIEEQLVRKEIYEYNLRAKLPDDHYDNPDWNNKQSIGKYTDGRDHHVDFLITKKSYSYEFDSIGNWTKKVTMSNKKVVEIVDRKITYK